MNISYIVLVGDLARGQTHRLLDLCSIVVLPADYVMMERVGLPERLGSSYWSGVADRESSRLRLRAKLYK